ncbi:GTPase-activating protein SAC7 [Nakaseomyces bracarensis]|uniref:GTPase-activating protein SAC7 n=1 Tax=Nakaseomyces bracarensis TaxID=273131 RepID=A0ABR4NP84_9SACH
MIFWKKDLRVFGVTFEESLKTANSQVVHDGTQWGKVPVLVAKCGHFLKSHALETPGVFRVAGNTKRIRELQEVFSTPPSYGRDFEDWSQYSVHDVASLLKRYLTNMKDNEALIPDSLCDAFETILLEHPDVLYYLRKNSSSLDVSEPTTTPHSLEAHNVNEEEEPLVGINQAVIEYKMTILSGLTPDRRHLFMYLLDLLGLFASKADVNLMTASNLSAIFQPAILGHSRVFEKKEDRLILEFMIRYSEKLLALLCAPNDPFTTLFADSCDLEASPLSQSPPTPASTISSTRNNYFSTDPQEEPSSSKNAMFIPRTVVSGAAAHAHTADHVAAAAAPDADQYKRRSSLPWLYKLRHKV